ncbi:signal transduction histidine kinase [Conyzicola nivalis]|uniref:histidine kinase n=1 Tax=Conyzicola nivalis TaxID=1477021 RepID=A0ABV2QS18_9MICO
MTDDWLRPRPGREGYRRDAIGAALLAVGATVSAMLYTRVGYFLDLDAEPTLHPAPAWVSAIMIIAIAAPLAWRRRYPEVVAVVVSVAFFLTPTLRVPEALFGSISLFIAIYSVGAWSRNRLAATVTVTRILIIIGMFVWIGVQLVLTVDDPNSMPGYSRSGVFSAFASFAVINVLTNLLYFGGAYYFGSTAYRSARERAELEDRTAELAAERERSAQQAVALDRVRIARELHDVVAHHVSVMGVQAGAARRVIQTDPAQASASLSTIEESARTAVDELHRLLTTLRDSDSDDASTSSSTRGLDQLDDLVEESTAAGVPATLQIVGEPRPVTALVGFTVYRVTQEALTNVRKHAGARATVDVRLRYLPDGIELEVADTGVGRGLNLAGTGHGHVGMRERLAAVGGKLEVGPQQRGGYLVRARIVQETL